MKKRTWAKILWNQTAIHYMVLCCWPTYHYWCLKGNTKSEQIKQCNISPGLKRDTALRHANSPGSTWMFLKRENISWRTRISQYNDPDFVWFCSWFASKGDDSIGIDHWIEHNRNSSLHVSSSRMTWMKKKHNKLIYLSFRQRNVKKRNKQNHENVCSLSFISLVVNIE